MYSQQPCVYQAVGCSADDDCGEGLGCGWLDDKPTCLDINECVQDPDICNNSPGTVCRKLISSYKYVQQASDNN